MRLSGAGISEAHIITPRIRGLWRACSAGKSMEPLPPAVCAQQPVRPWIARIALSHLSETGLDRFARAQIATQQIDGGASGVRLGVVWAWQDHVAFGVGKEASVRYTSCLHLAYSR